MRALLVFVLALGCNAQALFRAQNVTASGGGSYSLNKTITFDHTKAPSTQANFPALITFTDTSFKSTGNGGSITNASGYDIVFATAAGCASPMTYEMAYWNPATGFVEAWVSIASLSSSVDTVIHLCGGNAAITTFQGGAAGAVWTAAGTYTLVSHFPNGSTLSLSDYSGNGRNGTNSAGTAVTGVADGGIGTAASSYATFPQSSLTGLTTATVSIWVKTTTTSAQWPLGSGLGVCASNGFGGIHMNSAGSQNAASYVDSGNAIDSTHTTTDGNWHRLKMVYTPTTVSIKVDANTAVTTTGITNPAIGSGDALDVGSYCSNGASGADNFVGSLDELQVLNGTTTDDQDTTEFNNISSPGTFYSIT